jgi:prepilin-type N-terminal cleavage/methylation domain-containing protein
MSTRCGFSLLEALVALALVGGIAAAALTYLAVELESGRRNLDHLHAAALAQHRLAEIRLLSDAELESLRGRDVRGQFEEPFSGFEWLVRIEAGASPDRLYRAKVIVTSDLARVQLDRALPGRRP